MAVQFQEEKTHGARWVQLEEAAAQNVIWRVSEAGAGDKEAARDPAVKSSACRAERLGELREGVYRGVTWVDLVLKQAVPGCTGGVEAWRPFRRWWSCGQRDGMTSKVKSTVPVIDWNCRREGGGSPALC